jgi:hypothetical protein
MVAIKGNRDGELVGLGLDFYGCLGFAAFGLAVGAWGKENPEMFSGLPTFFSSSKWAAAPAILFVLATVIFIARLLGQGSQNNPVAEAPPLASRPVVSALPPVEPARFYSTGDKERISEAFYKLSQLLNKPVTKIEQDSQGLIQYWDGVKSSPSRNNELKKIISQLEALRTLSGTTYSEFTQLFADYKSYWDILADILQVPPVERDRPLIAWQYAVNDFHRALTTFDSLQTTVQPRTLEELGLLINPTQDKFRDAVAKLNDWVLQCNMRIKEKEAGILKSG